MTSKHSPAAPTVALVLGSGGARGLAHIGVIRELEARGYRIPAIAGSSMGALVGGIFATGRLDVFTDWVSGLDRLDVLRLTDFSFTGGGLIRGDRIIDVLREMIGDYDIESLPVRFTAVAAELDSGREVWFNRGSLFDAIRASIAIPGVFRPVKLNDRLLVDGAIVDPVPVGPMMSEHTDRVVIADVNHRRDENFDLAAFAPCDANSQPEGYAARLDQFIESIRGAWRGSDAGESAAPAASEDVNAFEVALRAMDTLQTTLSRYKLAAYVPDVAVRLPRNACTFADFHRARELIAAGQALAADALDRSDATRTEL